MQRPRAQTLNYKNANDYGSTPATIIIGVIVGVVVVAAATATATIIRQQRYERYERNKLLGVRSSALTTLRTAVAAAYAAYADGLPGGVHTFSQRKPCPSGIIEYPCSRPHQNATALAVATLQEYEPAIDFIDKAEYGLLKDSPPRPYVVWVDTIDDAEEIKATSSGYNNLNSYTNPNGHPRDQSEIKNVSIVAGDLIRLGIIATSGESFCVILVMNDSHDRISGEGWQGVDEANTLAGAGADCGAEVTGDPVFLEMPNTPGTDPKISAVVTSLNPTPAIARAYSR